MKINITSEKYDLDMNIHYRLTLVNSHSGTGKTSIGKIFKHNKDEDAKLKVHIDDKQVEDDTIIYLNDETKHSLIDCALYDDVIIILDEINFEEYNKRDIDSYNSKYDDKIDIAKKRNSRSSLWLKVINQSRAIIIIFNRDENINTSVHMKSVYEFKCDGRKHWIERKYLPIPVKRNIVYDTILTEDEKSGYFLMTSLYKDADIESAKSKDNVVNTLYKLVSRGKRNILVIVDICAFGTVAYKFMSFYKQNEFIQLALLDMESIEYMFLKTNMFRHVNIIDDTMRLPVLMERYYTNMLNNELIKHTSNGYDKGVKSKFLYENCCHEDSKWSEKCGLYLSGDKFKQMFKGTKYEYLLELSLKKGDNKNLS